MTVGTVKKHVTVELPGKKQLNFEKKSQTVVILRNIFALIRYLYNHYLASSRPTNTNENTTTNEQNVVKKGTKSNNNAVKLNVGLPRTVAPSLPFIKVINSGLVCKSNGARAQALPPR